MVITDVWDCWIIALLSWLLLSKQQSAKYKHLKQDSLFLNPQLSIKHKSISINSFYKRSLTHGETLSSRAPNTLPEQEWLTSQRSKFKQRSCDLFHVFVWLLTSRLFDRPGKTLLSLQNVLSLEAASLSFNYQIRAENRRGVWKEGKSNRSVIVWVSMRDMILSVDIWVFEAWFQTRSTTVICVRLWEPLALSDVSPLQRIFGIRTEQKWLFVLPVATIQSTKANWQTPD